MAVLLTVAGVLLLVGIGVLVSRRRSDPTDLPGSALAAREAAHIRAARAAAPAPDVNALVQQVRMHMARRQLIQAVKVWRAATGVSLAEAVRAVALIENGTVPPRPGHPAGPQPGPELITRARHLKLQGLPVEAIRLVRRHTGMGLREARKLVDSL